MYTDYLWKKLNDDADQEAKEAEAELLQEQLEEAAKHLANGREMNKQREQE